MKRSFSVRWMAVFTAASLLSVPGMAAAQAQQTQQPAQQPASQPSAQNTQATESPDGSQDQDQSASQGRRFGQSRFGANAQQAQASPSIRIEVERATSPSRSKESVM